MVIKEGSLAHKVEFSLTVQIEHFTKKVVLLCASWSWLRTKWGPGEGRNWPHCVVPDHHQQVKGTGVVCCDQGSGHWVTKLSFHSVKKEVVVPVLVKCSLFRLKFRTKWGAGDSRNGPHCVVPDHHRQVRVTGVVCGDQGGGHWPTKLSFHYHFTKK